jgi:hypothetical protein
MSKKIDVYVGLAMVFSASRLSRPAERFLYKIRKGNRLLRVECQTDSSVFLRCWNFVFV